MTSLIDYILSLFRSEDAARSFVAAPGRAMTSAGLIDIAPHQISSVAANVVPGLNLGAGDPMSGLRHGRRRSAWLCAGRRQCRLRR
uniref:Mutant IniB n=1 Tax=Mycobacterium tuberculosis TaxID=1773 RepID=Q4TUY0_MYCTX|nr:mutant IniB [Mycobacterium tuberculosis]